MHDKNKDISINVGSGVSRLELELPQLEVRTPSTTETNIDLDEKSNNEPVKLVEFNDRFLYNNVGQKTYYNKAFLKGQSRQPGMYKLGYPKAKLFTLATDQDLEQYNNFLAQLGGENEDPQIANLNIDKQFHDGKFVILASYNEVWYILPEQK